MTLGPRTMTALKLLARFKRVRGTWLDPFGRTAERKMERALIAEYRQTVDQLLDGERGQARTGGHHRRPRGNGTRLRPREGRERRSTGPSWRA